MKLFLGEYRNVKNMTLLFLASASLFAFVVQDLAQRLKDSIEFADQPPLLVLSPFCRSATCFRNSFQKSFPVAIVPANVRQ